VIKEIKEGAKEVKETVIDTIPKPEAEVPIPEVPSSDVSQLISRISGLEQAVEEQEVASDSHVLGVARRRWADFHDGCPATPSSDKRLLQHSRFQRPGLEPRQVQ
jgi:hypothetical protein